jgi:addiction module HigA family antidote
VLDLDRIPVKTVSTHPGAILMDEFLVPNGLTVEQLAQDLELPKQRVRHLVTAKGNLTVVEAVLLADHFGTSTSFWMNLQNSYDLSKRCVEDADFLAKIKNLKSKSKREAKRAMVG